MACNNCGQQEINCGCNTPSQSCCEGDERFIAERPRPGEPRKYPHDIKNAEVINSEISTDCNTPSAGCTATEWEATPATRCQKSGDANTGLIERMYSRINDECVQEYSWVIEGPSEDCVAAVSVTITEVSCGNPVLLEITGVSCE